MTDLKISPITEILAAVDDLTIKSQTGSHLRTEISTLSMKGFRLTVSKPTPRKPYAIIVEIVDHEEFSNVTYYDTREYLEKGLISQTSRSMLNTLLERSVSQLQATISKLTRIAMEID